MKYLQVNWFRFLKNHKNFLFKYSLDGNEEFQEVAMREELSESVENPFFRGQVTNSDLKKKTC